MKIVEHQLWMHEVWCVETEKECSDEVLRRHVHNWARDKSICDIVSMYMQTQLSQWHSFGKIAQLLADLSLTIRAFGMITQAINMHGVAKFTCCSKFHFPDIQSAN